MGTAKDGDRRRPVGVILAGGDGRRIGGDKAVVHLAGRPLLHHALSVMESVCGDVVVVAKVHTALPSLPGVTAVWVEPEQRTHPVAGIVHALREAAGRPILVCGGHLPLVDRRLLRELAEGVAGAPALLARAGDRVEPLLGRYEASSLGRLAPQIRLSRPDIVGALREPAFIDRPPSDPAFTTVHAPEDLITAESLLRARRRRSLASG